MITLFAGHFCKLTKVVETVPQRTEQADDLLKGGALLP